MGRSQHDPLKDFLVDLFSSDTPKGQAGKAEETAVGKYTAFAPFAVIATAFAFYTPQLVELTGHASENQIASVAASIHRYRWLILIITLSLISLDIVRFLSHRRRVRLDAQVRQATRHLPVKVAVGFPPGITTLRSARITLARGAIIRPKEMDELTSAVRASASRPGGKWTYTLRREAHRDQIVITRKEVAPDTRSARHKALDKALKDGPLKDPVVTVDSHDDNGIETAFKITFTPSLNSGARAFQKKVDEALAALAGEHESGRTWATDWSPSQGYLVMSLRAPLPTRVDHPLELVGENLRHLPYATAASDQVMFWDISTKSNKPHSLIVGPTGGGKTSVIRTLLTEASRRGIPFLGVDPKMIELDGLEGYPGCAAIVYDAVRSAMLVRALHSEMMARNHYVHVKKIEPSQLPLLITVLDEFFILSGKWQRLAKTGDDETRELLKELDPLGAWADLAVLARSAGIRLLLGVQRPDASLFGGASGNARDNFGTRISLGNLSQDGAMMMWGDSQVGREIDTSVPGRGVALGNDGIPVDAQMWWTPNVDPHPNKWNQLSDSEKKIINGLRPQQEPQIAFYSKELRQFIESERSMATAARERGHAPEPTVLDQYIDTPASTADDDIADAIPASAVTEGMTVLIDDGHGNEYAATVFAVTIIRDKDTGNVTETTLTFHGTGRVKNHITYGPHEVVILPEPDKILTPV
ncbi:FtsK/SpoIIIE domain-containing protein [Rhodococcus sp. IEGM 1379]|uniref:FtsK/SpoIIIE domain-containing protein n=1 Tax=Rhodococcus sp. IEGM 1379 TaxID=3047086 RepID=UPI0024B7A9A8|nr:FtsK/SpoIIIE domain-containing protein [Rhodococcus sp. IEGM 1379]MDI9915400.1 FtsK/SpoIIIE domain-containing protein [Rhodococcus sp. IEGM 1379]